MFYKCFINVPFSNKKFSYCNEIFLFYFLCERISFYRLMNKK